MIKSNMKQWELAELLQISEFTLSRKFRKELPEEEQKRIVSIIKASMENQKKGI